MARTKPPPAPRPTARRPARGTAKPHRRRPAPRRPAPRRSLGPLLTPDQRRELAGIAAVGGGVVLAAVLAVPDGGTVAGPIHDGLLDGLGAGAWVLAAGAVVAGVRTLGRRGWTGGLLGALGTVTTVVALLGMLGLADAGAAGAVGQRIGPDIAARLGTAATGAAMLLVVCLGLVLAVDLRVGPLAARTWAWWLRQRERERAAAAAVQTPAAPDARRGAGADGEPVIEAVGRSRGRGATDRRAPAVFDPPDAELRLEPLDLALGGSAPDAAASTLPEPAAESVPLVPVAPFRREFEGLPVEVDESAAPLGEIPEVALAHAGDGDAAQPGDEPEKVWVLPTLDLLEVAGGKRERLEQEVRATAVTIEATLQSFGIEARIRGVNSGPTVTQYELQPAKGVPVRKITGHQTDLSLALAAPIRIQAPIPGKAAIGIEVPNKAAQLVAIREIVSAPAFAETRSRLAVTLGADVSGHPVLGDLTRMPHLLIAGATGSGKSVCINAVLAGFLLQATPAQLKLILIDPKRVELSNFADVPHLLVPVVVEPDAAVASLRWAVKEMEERYKLFASHGARNIVAFNERAPGLGLAPLPYTVIVIDELADLMMVAAGEIEDLICRIAQLARAVGIHLIVATQRPSADIITGLIKANIPSRVAFAVSSGV
ncbi:MAG: DNA translocase FtsK, partial [Chloroflexi bacterium]